MNLADFDYDLPPEFIAQTPMEPRDAARLLVLNRATGQITHSRFDQLVSFLDPGDALIFNDTRVIPARLTARRVGTGGKVEVLLLKRQAPLTWEVLVGGKRLPVGSLVDVDGDSDLRGVVLQEFDGARRLLQFSKPITPLLEQLGTTPLPPYIHTPLANPGRYQTVYAQAPGSAAAPTAGLHFTPGLLERARAAGIGLGFVTLHVGLDTFAPVAEEDVSTHAMHGEWCELPPETAALINATRQAGRRVVAVGTTSVRTLESAPVVEGVVQAFTDTTRLFILPGHRFQSVGAMITNFHLPRTTLLMLVSAFAGRDQVLQAYESAKQERYRFYSFGDSMLIL